MENLLIYLALSGLYITILYLGILIASYRNYNFSNQRFLVLSSLGFGLILPLIHFGGTSQEIIYAYNLPMLEIGNLTEMVTSTSEVKIKAFGLLSLLFLCFTIGAALLLMRFLYGIVKLFLIIKNGESESFKEHHIIRTSQVKGPCSFWKYILVPSTFRFDEQASEIILKHEEKHLKLHHSLDSILLSIFQIAFWWLPTFYLFQHRLKLIHEYEVDAYMTQNQNALIYSNFLIEQVPIHQKLLHTNNFYSFIKKRISMMYQEKKSSSKLLQYGIYTLLIPALFLFQSFQTAQDEGGKLKTYTETVTNTHFVFDPETKKEIVKEVSFDRTVYEDVDQVPLFVSCIDLSKSEEEMEKCSHHKLMEYLGANLKFPDEAKEAKLEGRLISEFVITEDGDVESVKIVNPIGYGTSEAVIKVVEGLNNSDLKWKPAMVNGKAVNIKYTLPVKFSLQ